MIETRINEDDIIHNAVEIDSVKRKDVIMSAYDEIKNTNPKDIISYGYSWLDDKLSGIFPGQLILIGGESGTGKTLFTSGIVYKCKKPAAIFSLEERLEDFGKKALYFEIGKIRKQENKKQYPWKVFVRGELNDDQDFEKDVAKAYENLKTEYPLFQKMDKVATIDVIEKRIELLAWQ
jgi:replicative DNA helicase